MKFCCIYLNLTLHNTLITLTDLAGNVICWSSAGNNGFKGSRKKTAFAIQTTILSILQKAKFLNFTGIKLFIKRLDQQIEPLISLFYSSRFFILTIKEITPRSFNGCRLPKLRKI